MTPVEMMWAVAGGVIIARVILWGAGIGLSLWDRAYSLEKPIGYVYGAIFVLIGLVAMAWVIDTKVFGSHWGH